MKGIVTALAALVALTGAALADGVASRNVVGYTSEDHSIPRVQTIQFWAVGASGQEADLTELIEADTIGEYSDELQIYDPENGVFVTHMWDGTQWINAETDDPLSASADLTDGFLFVTGLESITQNFPTNE